MAHCSDAWDRANAASMGHSNEGVAMLSFFEVQRRQQQRTVIWLAAEVVLLTAVGYFVSLPVQFVKSCSNPDLNECAPLGFDLGVAMWVLLGVLAYLAFALWMVQRRAYPAAGRAPSNAPHEFRLTSIVEQMAIASGAPMPRVVVLDDFDLNAYAAADLGNGMVAVTSGLLAVLDNRELTGVVAHEMAHLKNRDSRVIWLATFGVGLIAFLAVAAAALAVSAAQTSTSNDDDDNNDAAGAAAIGAIFAIVLGLFAFPAAILLKATISRRREQLADACAVQFTRDPTGLRSALEKLSAGAPTQPASLRVSNAALWIRNPFASSNKPRWVQRLLNTHPPMEQRIAWLRSLEGANAVWLNFDR